MGGRNVAFLAFTLAQYFHPITLTPVYAQIALFKMQEGKGKDLVEFFLSPKGLGVTRAYKGCIQFDVLTEVNDLDAVRIYEKWESKEDWEAYVQFRGQSGEMDFLKTMLASEPVFIPCAVVG
jgi:quinol monooxygenase YgiN